jgi:hypothetical protein
MNLKCDDEFPPDKWRPVLAGLEEVEGDFVVQVVGVLCSQKKNYRLKFKFKFKL